MGETKRVSLRWLGHAEYIGEDRAVKRAYMGQPASCPRYSGTVGRPRCRWKDEVVKDLKELKWSELA